MSNTMEYARLLKMIAYPRRGQMEEGMSLQDFADAIQDKFPLWVLEADEEEESLTFEDGVRQSAAVCDRLVMALDGGGNQYRRPAPADQCATAIRKLLQSPSTVEQSAALSDSVDEGDK